MTRFIQRNLGSALALVAKAGGMGTRAVQPNAQQPLAEAVVPAPSPVPLGLSPDGISPSGYGREETDVHNVKEEREGDREREHRDGGRDRETEGNTEIRRERDI